MVQECLHQQYYLTLLPWRTKILSLPRGTSQRLQTSGDTSQYRTRYSEHSVNTQWTLSAHYSEHYSEHYKTGVETKIMYLRLEKLLNIKIFLLIV